MPGRLRRGAARPVIFLIAIAAISGLYQILAIFACLRRTRRQSASHGHPPVSILKPVRGVDSGFREAIASHAGLPGEYELLCGVGSPDDPAVAVLREFPRARILECRTRKPNGKAGVLRDLAAAARSRRDLKDLAFPPTSRPRRWWPDWPAWMNSRWARRWRFAAKIWTASADLLRLPTISPTIINWGGESARLG